MALFDLRKDNLTQLMNKSKEPFTGPNSGIASLDNYIVGFGKGEVITIGGRTSMGKSSLARDILLNVGNPINNWGVALLCTMEMPSDEVISLLCSTTSKVNYDKIKKGFATKSELERFDAAGKLLSNYNIIVDDESYVTADYIRKVLKYLQNIEPIACLIVDYLQLMVSTKACNNRQEEVSNISRELKLIAMEFNIPLIMLSQLSRNVEYRESARPRMIDLRESGSIENDSSKVILLHRQDYYNKQLNPDIEETGEAEFIIPKCRGGKTGVAKCAWINEYTSFCDIPKGYIDEF